MKQLVILAGCVVILSALAGCQNPNFPKVMVGVWEADVSTYSKWGIKFERDGSIEKIIHPLAGPVRLSEGGVFLEGRDPNSHATFIMGPCDADYLPETNELKVAIILDYYKMKLPNGVLEGRIETYISGPVSEDGETWPVEVREYGWLEGAASPDTDMIDANPDKLMFTKIDLKQYVGD